MSKILTVEGCWNCPFLEGTDYSTTKPFCKKLRLSGSTDVLFKSCPLPDDAPLRRSHLRPKGYIQYG